LPQAFADYLVRHHVLTLATQGPEGPWAAAVFYASDGYSLIFVSSPGSRHCRNLSQDPRCAATIQEDYSDWQQIKGFQLGGLVRELQGDEESRAMRLYAEKFPILRASVSAPPAVLKALARVRWYRLHPTSCFFIDNSLGFGHREEVDLGGN